MTTQELLKKAKAAKSALSNYTVADIDRALTAMADALVADCDAILTENAADIEASKGVISDVMIDRLSLSPERIEGMAQGIRDVVKLPSPVGKVLNRVERPGGLVIEKTSVALGVVAIIYESRPNVTSDAAALALKSGNVCVLRCGKEAHRSAAAIVKALQKGLTSAGLPEDFVLLVEDTTRASANELMTADGYVDLLIPRGGPGLINACVKNATVPCIQTGTGICHIYVDSSADPDMALNIIENAKTSRPSVCNAEEVLVVARDIAPAFLPRLKERLVDDRAENPVELRLDPEAQKIIDGTPAGENDFDTEFLDYILAVKIVADVDEAIAHINRHSTGHSEAIVTSDAAALALKSGNVCVLRCGKEAHGSAAAIVKALREGLTAAGLPEDMILLIEDTTRQSANELMTADGYVDLLIPRGGKGLISAIVKNATVPCIQTGTGICHIYIDSTADIDMAVDIVENAKCSRPSVCNAEEVLVVAEDVAADFLPKLKARIVDGRTENPVELRLDEKAAKIIDGTPAGENDFDTEFLDYILAVKTVKNVDEAIAHINAHSTGHSEAIVTRDEQAAEKFTRGVDSSSVYVNASTRFTDGGEFGLGCEMGISTQKLHARGPMGLEELNTYKYIIKGKGHIR